MEGNATELFARRVLECSAFGLTPSCSLLDDGDEMDAEQTIAEIECLERIFEVPDTRPLSPSDLSAANRRHDEKQASSPWFRLWQRYGVCCRAEYSVIQLPE